MKGLLFVSSVMTILLAGCARGAPEPASSRKTSASAAVTPTTSSGAGAPEVATQVADRAYEQFISIFFRVITQARTHPDPAGTLLRFDTARRVITLHSLRTGRPVVPPSPYPQQLVILDAPSVVTIFSRPVRRFAFPGVDVKGLGIHSRRGDITVAHQGSRKLLLIDLIKEIGQLQYFKVHLMRVVRDEPVGFGPGKKRG